MTKRKKNPDVRQIENKSHPHTKIWGVWAEKEGEEGERKKKRERGFL